MVYGRLLRYAGKKGVAFPHTTELADEVGLCDRQTREYIKELIDENFIIKRRVFAKGNVYEFLRHPCYYDPNFVSPNRQDAAEQIEPSNRQDAAGANRQDAAVSLAPYPLSHEESHKEESHVGEFSTSNIEEDFFSGRSAVKPRGSFRSRKRVKAFNPDAPSEKLKRLREMANAEVRTVTDSIGEGVVVPNGTNHEQSPTEPPSASTNWYPFRWNQLVPSAHIEWNPATDPASLKRLKSLVLVPEFTEHFDELCAVCQQMLECEGEFVSFPWVLKSKDGTDNWRRVLGELRWMAKKKAKAEKPKTNMQIMYEKMQEEFRAREK
jgi:hypothetical protein